MIPSYFKIEILAIRDEFVTQEHKGLIGTCRSYAGATIARVAGVAAAPEPLRQAVESALSVHIAIFLCVALVCKFENLYLSSLL